MLGVAIAGCSPRSSDRNLPEMDAYIAEIRDSRMMEGARENMRAVVAIHIGHWSVTYSKNEASGKYEEAFRAVISPLSDRFDAERDSGMELIFPLADLDSSGFITTGEAQRFRELYEFGLQAAAVIEAEGFNRHLISELTRVHPVDLDDSVNEYNTLVERSDHLGIEGLEPVIVD